MSISHPENPNLNFLKSTGEIGKLIHGKDWELSDLGPAENWPQSLYNSLGIILNTDLPMLLFWGPKNNCFFNSEFLAATKLPKEFTAKLGIPGHLVFPGTWKQLQPIIKVVLNARAVSKNENYFINKKEVETINFGAYKFNYGPVFGEKGIVEAVLVSFREINKSSINNEEKEKIRLRLKKEYAETKVIIENAIFPICIIKADNFEILTANEPIIKIWGKGNKVVGKQLSEIMPELEAQKIFEILNTVIETGLPHFANNQLFKIIKNGETVTEYFNYNFVPLKDEAGKVYAVLNTAVDITEVTESKMKIENTVNELKLFKFMADNAADKLILIRRDASFAYVNKKVLSKWGYSQEEIKQLSVFDIDTLYKKEDFETLFNQSFEDNSIQIETFHKNKSGEVFPVEISITGLELDEEPFIFVIARDITERKKAEQELRRAFANIESSEKRFRESVKKAPFGIAIFKGENFIAEMANDDYYKIIGRNEDAFLNKPLFEVLPEIKEDIEPILSQVYKSGKAHHSYESPAVIQKPHGLQPHFFNLVYHPLLNEEGKSTGIMVVAVDVSENVLAKNKLQESEKQFKNMVMRSPVAITILRGEDFIIETANNMMLKKIMVYEEKEVIGKPLLNVFPEMINQDYPTLLKSIYKRGKNLNIEEGLLILNRGKGIEDKMIVDISFTPIPATENTATAIMVTASIVTEKVEARKNVELSNERLRLATEAAEMGTWEIDLETKALIHSPQLAKIFGEEATETFDFDVLRNKFFVKDLVEIVQPAFEQAAQTGYYFYEARIMKSPDAISWIRTQGKVVFDDKGMPLRMMGTTVDITEGKRFTEKLAKSEERFRLLANEVPQLIWTADPQGNIIYYNESVFNFSGLTQEALAKDGWLVIVHPDDKEQNLQLWMQAVNHGTDFLFEHRFRRFDGVYRWQLSRAVPQRNELGEIQAWVGSSTDIQEIKELEQQKDFFISMASHELKTPVTSIKGYVQILQSLYNNSNDKFLKDSLMVVDRQIVTLTKLITELLDISKIKSGALDVKEEEFEMPALIMEIVHQLKHTNPQDNIQLKALPAAIVNADRDRIGQVLINLLTNAIKYAPNAKSIELGCQIDSDFVKVSIKDEGIGISKLNQEKIFDRFFRVEGKNEQTYPGFGIGLFIASEIIKKHKGTIQVVSELGKGSIFSFSLPLHK